MWTPATQSSNCQSCVYEQGGERGAEHGLCQGFGWAAAPEQPLMNQQARRQRAPCPALCHGQHGSVQASRAAVCSSQPQTRRSWALCLPQPCPARPWEHHSCEHGQDEHFYMREELVLLTQRCDFHKDAGNLFNSGFTLLRSPQLLSMAIILFLLLFSAVKPPAFHWAFN